MKEILKGIGFYRIDNYIDIFVLSGKIERGNILENRFMGSVFLPLILLSIILLGLSGNIGNGFFIIVSLIILFVMMFSFMFFEKNIISVKAYNIFKKVFKKIIRKKFNMKDKEMIAFVNEYFYDIRRLQLSKKETIKFVNDWKNSKKLLDKKRAIVKKEKIKELEKRLKELK